MAPLLNFSSWDQHLLHEAPDGCSRKIWKHPISTRHTESFVESAFIQLYLGVDERQRNDDAMCLQNVPDK